MRLKIPDEFRQRIAEERRTDRMGAKAFSDACAAGDADWMEQAAHFLNDSCVDGWRLAMQRVAKLPTVSDDIRHAFLNQWIEMKMLPLKVGNRRVLASALRVLLPCNYIGPPLHLYRGTSAGERRRRLYGFSWTTNMDVAAKFAQERRWAEGAVILETVAPANSIMLIREIEDYYDEGEVVVDPFMLGPIDVALRLLPEEFAGIAIGG